MSEEIDYKKLKFKAGLEIHQQLDTGKLFCRCPSVLRTDEPDFVVERKLHAVPGESGEVDVAALYQASLKKKFFYQGYNDTTCLIELDEEPPKEINPAALETAIQIALHLNCKIQPTVQIMRKTVIDGSNTSGFQRTVLIARDGFLETSQGKVEISYIYLEEDAARIIEREKDHETYRLDRLGIPLVEVVTAPDLKSPEHAKETALKIGEILRSCKVRRGIGTIRQDLNLSIENGKRIEIKGMQDMKIFEKAAENEVLRQKKLIASGKEVENEVRNVLPDANTEYMRPLPGSSRMYPETDLPLLKISRQMINDTKKTLPKLTADISEELKQQGLSQEFIKILLKEDRLEEYKELYSIVSQADLIVKTLIVWPKEIAKHNNIQKSEIKLLLNKDTIAEIFESYKKEKIQENQIQEVLKRIASGIPFKESLKFESLDTNETEEQIRKIIKSKPGLSQNAYMGLVMKEFKGKIDGKTAMELIGKVLN